MNTIKSPTKIRQFIWFIGIYVLSLSGVAAIHHISRWLIHSLGRPVPLNASWHSQANSKQINQQAQIVKPHQD